MWLSFMYTPVIPLVSLFSMFGLVIYYYADKFNVINRRTIKENISAELSNNLFTLLEYVVTCHAFGNFFFKY